MNIQDADKETLERWYAKLNCYDLPDDFPLPLPSKKGREIHDDPSFVRAWNEVTSRLTAAEQSRGWWIYALGETEQTWFEWWTSCGKDRQAAVEALAGAGREV